jgi:hypothetical protein
MNTTRVSPRGGGSAWYHGEKWCPAELEFAIRELRARCKRLKRDPVDDELRNSCGAKVGRVKHLTDALELDDEIREAARSLLAETEQELDAMPIGSRSRLISPPYLDAW